MPVLWLLQVASICPEVCVNQKPKAFCEPPICQQMGCCFGRPSWSRGDALENATLGSRVQDTRWPEAMTATQNERRLKSIPSSSKRRQARMVKTSGGRRKWTQIDPNGSKNLPPLSCSIPRRHRLCRYQCEKRPSIKPLTCVNYCAMLCLSECCTTSLATSLEKTKVSQHEYVFYQSVKAQNMLNDICSVARNVSCFSARVRCLIEAPTIFHQMKECQSGKTGLTPGV